MDHREIARQSKGRCVERVLADDVKPGSGNGLEHRRQRSLDTRRRERLPAAGHDEGCPRIARRGHRGQAHAVHLRSFGAVQHDVVAASGQAGSQVADECLRAAYLRRAKGRHRRGDDGDSHGRVLV